MMMRQPFSSWMVVTVRPSASVLVAMDRACPRPPRDVADEEDEDETLTEDRAELPVPADDDALDLPDRELAETLLAPPLFLSVRMVAHSC